MSKTFAQNKEGEMRHINALLPLLERYQVPLKYVSNFLGHKSIKTTADPYLNVTKK